MQFFPHEAHDMTITIPVQTLVEGLSLELTWHADNPALDERFTHLFHDGWYETIVESDGRNPYYPPKSNWRICVVWKQKDIPFKISSQDNTAFVSLVGGDVVESISVTEEVLSGPDNTKIFGLWHNVFYRHRDGNSLRHAQLIKELGDSWQAQ